MMSHKFGWVLSCLAILLLLGNSGCSDSPHHSGKVLELEQVDYVTHDVLLETLPQSMRVGREYFTHLDADVNDQSAQGILDDIWKYIKDNLGKYVH